MEHRVFLSMRNVQTLLNKLDRNKHGEGGSACTLIKYDNQHAKYPQTMIECAVTAVETVADGKKNTSSQIYLTRESLEALLVRPSLLPFAVLNESDQHEAMIIASLEDAEYYSTRTPGEVHPSDDPGMKR